MPSFYVVTLKHDTGVSASASPHQTAGRQSACDEHAQRRCLSCIKKFQKNGTLKPHKKANT